MKKPHLLLFFKHTLNFKVLFSLVYIINVLGYSQFCATNHSRNQYISFELTTELSEIMNSHHLIVVNLYFNVMNSNNISNVNEEDLIQATDQLNQFYRNTNIAFRFNGYRNYFQNQYASIDSDNEFFELADVNPNRDNLQIYLVDNMSFFGLEGITGRAEDITGRYLSIVKGYEETYILAHEIGHCFNLYHTFHGMSPCENIENSFEEDIDGSNCTIAGDYVCDTPADPCMTDNDVSESCAYLPNNAYNPDTRNIMSYTSIDCGQRLTLGQTTRMRQALLTSSVLNPFQIDLSFLSSPLSTDVTRTNYRRQLVGGGCFEISYVENHRIQFQKGFNYIIEVTNKLTSRSEIYRFSAIQTPIININFNSYSYTARILDYPHQPNFTKNDNAGFQRYLECPTWFPIFGTHLSQLGTPIQAGYGVEIRPGLYSVPIYDIEGKEIIEIMKIFIR